MHVRREAYCATAAAARVSAEIGMMYRTRAGAASCIALLLPLVCQGCTGGAAGGLPFGTATHKLLETTEYLRQSSPVAAPLPRELERGVLPAYYVEPGDALLVQPADLDSPARLPTDQTVLPDGNIELGLYGRLQVAGKTPEQIERDVTDLVRARTPSAGVITVRLIGRQSKVVYVLGEVNAPGAYPLTGRESVLDAIMLAGGLTDSADQGRITYTKPTPPDACRVVLPVCYRDIVQIGDTSTNYQVAPGDRIFVPSMNFCQQIKEAIHGSPEPECPPCGLYQEPCGHVKPDHVPVVDTVPATAKSDATPSASFRR